MMLAGLVVLCLSLSAGVVVGELCEFPGDHPIEDLENGDTVPAQTVVTSRAYVYTDQFGDCHGSVRRINFCYQPTSNYDSLMTIEIRNPDEDTVGSYDVIVNSSQDMNNCQERYNLHFTQCCVEQNLTQSLIVHPDSYYALVIPSTGSILLHHSTETANGYQENHVGNPVGSNVYKPLFYFTIDTSDSDCSNIHTTTTASLTESSTISINRTSTISESAINRTGATAVTDKTTSVSETTTTSSSKVVTITTTPEQREKNNSLYISVGVALPVVILISLTVFIISVTLCLRRRRKRKLITSENVSYHSSNAQFTMTKTSTEQYDYVSTHRPHPPHNTEGVAISNNEAYGKLEREMAENVAYGVNEVELSDNVAYTSTTTTARGGAEDGGNYDYITDNDIIISSPNEAYGTTNDMTLCTNQSYGQM